MRKRYTAQLGEGDGRSFSSVDGRMFLKGTWAHSIYFPMCVSHNVKCEMITTDEKAQLHVDS